MHTEPRQYKHFWVIFGVIGCGFIFIIATSIVISCLVDFTRLSVYGIYFFKVGGMGNLPLLSAATGSAFLGAFIGSRFMKKATMRAIQILISIMLLGIAVALGLGLI